MAIFVGCLDGKELDEGNRGGVLFARVNHQL